MAGAGAVRLYVGGLPQEISGDDVAARFTPFGSVLQLELAPEKGGSTTGGAKRCRGFGYVNFMPKDDKSLSRCLSLYNGCMWRGHKLRVERAHPDFQARLQAEWDAEEEEELAASKEDGAEAEVSEEESNIPLAPSDAMLNIVVGGVGSKVMRIPLTPAHTPLTHKKYFPPMKSNISVASLSWEAPEHIYTRREKLLIGASSCKASSGYAEDRLEAGEVSHTSEDRRRAVEGPLSPSSRPAPPSHGSLEASVDGISHNHLNTGVTGGSGARGVSKHRREESEARLINRTAYVSLHGGGAESSAPDDRTGARRGWQEVAQAQAGEAGGQRKRQRGMPSRGGGVGSSYPSGHESDSTSEDYSELRRLAASQGAGGGGRQASWGDDDDFEVVGGGGERDGGEEER